MAEASAMDKLRIGHLGQRRAFFRRRCDGPGRFARRGIWALRLPSGREYIRYVLTFHDAIASSSVCRRAQRLGIYGRIHFSSRRWLAFSEFIRIAEYPGPVFLD